MAPLLEDYKFLNMVWIKEELGRKNGNIIEEIKRAKSERLANWKAPGPDGVQGFWLKKLTSLHDRIAEQADDVLNGRKAIAEWMMLGKKNVVFKDPAKGYAVDNRTIARWRHLTTTTRIQFGFALLFKLRLLFLNPQRDW